MNTIGIGGSTAEIELAKIQNKTNSIIPIQKDEFGQRIQKACDLMLDHNIEAIYLNAGTNLSYFTGTKWNPSERMVGAILTSKGKLIYIAPYFEIGTILGMMVMEAPVIGWHEHESPYQLFIDLLKKEGITSGQIGLDESTAYFITNGLSLLNSPYDFVNAKMITAGCRMIKSKNEIAIIQQLMDITLKVLEAAAKIIRPGISTQEVTSFIHEAHKKFGAPSGSYFCIVLFGVDSSFPHGVKSPKNLEEGEMVLMDTGCSMYGYISDITRTYVFGEANEFQTNIWNLEKSTQYAAFEAAKIGSPCSNIDKASRKHLGKNGLSSEYDLPGLPHRTGHGIGMDIHEWPYIVKSETTLLQQGMTFSNEPMICIPDQFGIRLEDHIYMTDEGPKWFTQPAHSINNPFGL